jgi:hypothetical protein
VECPETEERSGRVYQPHGCATPTSTQPKTQRETHTLLSRQASLSLALGWIPDHVSFFSCSIVSVRLRSPALLPARMLCRVHPCILCRATLLRILDLPRSLLPFVDFHIRIYFSFYYPFSVHNSRLRCSPLCLIYLYSSLYSNALMPARYTLCFPLLSYTFLSFRF